MDFIISSVNWQYSLVYLYGMVDFSKTLARNFSIVQSVFTLLQNAGVILKLKIVGSSQL